MTAWSRPDHVARAGGKQRIRERIWELLEKRGASAFPGARGRIPNFVGEIITNGIRDHKISISQSLHQCGSTQSICSMIRKIRFSQYI